MTGQCAGVWELKGARLNKYIEMSVMLIFLYDDGAIFGSRK